MTVLRLTPEQFAAKQAKAHAGRPAAPAPVVIGHFRLRLPYPPTLNHNTLPTAGGGRILTEQHRNFRALVAVQIYNARIRRLDGRLEITMWVSSPDKRGRDLDNVVKPTLDALQRGAAIKDDRLVERLHIYRMPPSAGGYVELEAREL